MGLTNEQFFKRHAAMGRIALVGGTTAIDKGIRFAQRHLIPDGRHSYWSHVFVLQGERVDGNHWLLESDIDIRLGKMLRVGVQENRIEKYSDDKAYPNIAVLDFGLSEADSRRLVCAGLDLAAGATRYALGGLLKTYLAMLRQQMGKERKKDSTYCSSFVRTVYQQVGVDLAEGVAVRHTAPEHIAQTRLKHQRFELIRQP